MCAPDSPSSPARRGSTPVAAAAPDAPTAERSGLPGHPGAPGNLGVPGYAGRRARATRPQSASPARFVRRRTRRRTEQLRRRATSPPSRRSPLAARHAPPRTSSAAPTPRRRRARSTAHGRHCRRGRGLGIARGLVVRRADRGESRVDREGHRSAPCRQRRSEQGPTSRRGSGHRTTPLRGHRRPDLDAHRVGRPGLGPGPAIGFSPRPSMRRSGQAPNPTHAHPAREHPAHDRLGRDRLGLVARSFRATISIRTVGTVGPPSGHRRTSVWRQPPRLRMASRHACVGHPISTSTSETPLPPGSIEGQRMSHRLRRYCLRRYCRQNPPNFPRFERGVVRSRPS